MAHKKNELDLTEGAFLRNEALTLIMEQKQKKINNEQIVQIHLAYEQWQVAVNEKIETVRLLIDYLNSCKQIVRTERLLNLTKGAELEMKYIYDKYNEVLKIIEEASYRPDITIHSKTQEQVALVVNIINGLSSIIKANNINKLTVDNVTKIKNQLTNAMHQLELIKEKFNNHTNKTMKLQSDLIYNNGLTIGEADGDDEDNSENHTP